MFINEERQPPNTESDSRREQLGVLDEQLARANKLLQARVEELEKKNSDLTNLLINTDISTILLDKDLRTQSHAPSSATLFNISSDDHGKPLSVFKPKFHDDSLLSDARQVLDTLVPIEREVETLDGRHLLRRIQPYHAKDGRVEGIALIFMDITGRVEGERCLRDSEARLRELNKELEVRVAERTAKLAQREAEVRAV